MEREIVDSKPPADAAPANLRARCKHRSLSGRRCRSWASGAPSPFCDRHSDVSREALDVPPVAPDTFQSAEGINGCLAELFTLLAGDRVSPRRAAVLAYISSLALRTLPAIEDEQIPKRRVPNINFDFEGPANEQIPDPPAPGSSSDASQS